MKLDESEKVYSGTEKQRFRDETTRFKGGRFIA